MPNITPTEQEMKLSNALRERGISVEAEYWDGHKHIDLYIPTAQLYIEIEGIQHYNDPKQILADFERDYYSTRNGFHTFRITNQLIDTHLAEITEAIVSIALPK